MSEFDSFRPMKWARSLLLMTKYLKYHWDIVLSGYWIGIHSFKFEKKRVGCVRVFHISRYSTFHFPAEKRLITSQAMMLIHISTAQAIYAFEFPGAGFLYTCGRKSKGITKTPHQRCSSHAHALPSPADSRPRPPSPQTSFDDSAPRSHPSHYPYSARGSQHPAPSPISPSLDYCLGSNSSR